MKTILSIAALSFTVLIGGAAFAETPAAPAKPHDAPAPAAQPAAAPAAAPADAAATDTAAPPADDPLKDIVIHKHPDDFATAQALAVQNRQERMEMLNRSMECVQKATNINELYDCQGQERKDLDKIWLSYCDTTVSFIGPRRVNADGKVKGRGGKKGGAQAQADDAAADVNAADANQKPKISDCDRALAAVTGKPLQKKMDDQAPQQQ